MTNQADARFIELVLAERDRQDEKWGANRQMEDSMWLTILVEEVGELAKAIFEGDDPGIEAEAIQVAAVAINMLKSREALLATLEEERDELERQIKINGR